MNFEGMDLNLLVAFNALMVEQNVTRAAALAGVSQPAMSAALSRLRRLFNDSLFIRSAEGLLPTVKAKEMYPQVSAALGHVREIIKSTKIFIPGVQKMSFTLGLTEYPMYIVLPELTRKLADLAPDCKIHVRYFSDRDETVALLDAGKIDVALSVAPSRAESRILSVPVLSDEFVTLADRDSEVARKGMNRQRFLSMKHILVSPEGNRYGLMDEKLREQGLKRQVGLTIPGMFVVPALLPGSEYVATVLRRVVRVSGSAREIMMFEPPVEMPGVQFHMLWHRRTDESSAYEWLRELIHEVCLSIQ